MAPIRSKSTLTVKHLQALGLVVAESARLESLIDRVIIFCGEIPLEVASLVLGPIMFAGKVKILSELFKGKKVTEELKANVASVVKRMHRVNAKRVIAVHGTWMSFDVPTMAQIEAFNGIPPSANAQASKTAGPHQGEFNAKDLGALAQEIADVSAALDEVFFEAWVVPTGRRYKRDERKMRLAGKARASS